MRTIAWLLPLPGLLLAGCAPPAAAPAPRPSTTASAPASAPPPAPSPEVAAPAPTTDIWVPPPPVPPLAGDGPRAYVADGPGLVEIAAPGGSQVLVPGQISWCNADARGQVVWYLQDGSLFAFDLVDRSVHKVLSDGGDAFNQPIITWGDQTLGGESKVDYTVAVQLTMTHPPSVGASIGCDGDREYYCYSDPAHPHQMNEDLLARKQAIEEMSLIAPGYLERVAARGAGGSLWAPPPPLRPVPRNKPKVDRSECDALPSVCGQLDAIPGTSLWRVIVGNDRGDFYSQRDALWDPATGQFLSLRDGELAHGKEPQANGDLRGLRISASGVLLFAGAVFDSKTVYFVPRDEGAMSCGWSGGGWRFPARGR